MLAKRLLAIAKILSGLSLLLAAVLPNPRRWSPEAPTPYLRARAAIIAAIKDAGYLHIPEGRRDHTTPAETLRLHGLD